MLRHMFPACLLVVALATLAAADPPSGEIKFPQPLPDAEADIQEADQVSAPMVVGPRREDGARRIHARKDCLGKRLRVEGIAWGQPFGLKGQAGTISPHVLPHVIHQGDSVFIKGIDFTETKALGKVVRVEGILRREPTTQTRFGDVPGYYYLEAEMFELIDAVTDPYLVLLEEK